MGDPFRALRVRPGFMVDVASLSGTSAEELLRSIIGFVCEAVEDGQLEALAEWELAAHPGSLPLS